MILKEQRIANNRS